MQINNKEECVEFKELNRGDTFKYQGGYYIKSDDIAVNLETGTSHLIKDGFPVIPVNLVCQDISRCTEGMSRTCDTCKYHNNPQGLPTYHIPCRECFMQSMWESK